MKNITDVGRILFAIPFAVFGINHFVNWEVLGLMYNTFIPNVVFTNFLVGLALVAASVSIILKKNVRLSCFLLAALLFVFIVSIHVPQLLGHKPKNMNSELGMVLAMTNMLKDIALMGGALLIAGLFGKQENVNG